MKIIGGWHYFGNNDFPKDQQVIYIRWNTNREEIRTWQFGCIDWSKDILPVSWKAVEDSDKFELGDRVKIRREFRNIVKGKIIDIEHPVLMNGAVLVGEHYKVLWDDGDESGWLSWHELELTN